MGFTANAECPSSGNSQLADFSEVQLSGSQIWNRIHLEKCIATWDPQIWQSDLIEMRQTALELLIIQRVQNQEAFTFLLIGTTGDDKDLPLRADQFVEFFFHLDMRDHLAADLAEAAQPVRDLYEAVFVHGRDIACNVPAVAQHLCGFFRTTEVTPHDVGAADK